jgi:hypothetical protein
MAPRNSLLANALLIPLLGGAALIAIGRKGSSSSNPTEDLAPETTTPSRSRRRGAQLGLAVAAASTAAVLAGGGTAWAYLRGASGHGTGVAATAAAPTVTASAASLLGTLYPGSTADLTVTLTNNSSNMSWTVTGLVANGNPTGGGTGCDTSNVRVLTSATFPPTTIAHGGSATVTFTAAVTMSASAPNACQNTSFTVPVLVAGQMG